MIYARKQIKRIILGSFFSTVCLFSSYTFAATSSPNAPLFSDSITAGVTSLNQIGNNVTPQTLAGTALGTLFTVIGAIVLLVIVYGGILLMTARGNSEQVQKAVKTLVWTALGTFVIFGGLALTRLIIRIFSGTSSGG